MRLSIPGENKKETQNKKRSLYLEKENEDSLVPTEQSLLEKKNGMSIVQLLFGVYTRQVFTQAMLYIELISCSFFFIWRAPHKKHVVLRALILFVAGWALVIPLSIFRTYYDTVFTRILVYYLIDLYFLVTMFFLLDCDRSSVLLLWCSCIAAKEATSQIYALIQLACGVDDQNALFFFSGSNDTNVPLWLFLNWVVHLVIYFAFAWLFAKDTSKEQDRQLVHKSIAISISSVALIVAFASVIRFYQKESAMLAWVGKALCLAISLYVLIVYRILVQENEARTEARVMSQVVHEESKRFDNVKSNIEMINMKTHDLKHRLEQFEGKLTEEEITSMQEAIKIYDTTVKTGNEVLDTIIYEEQLLLEKEKVTLTCMCDGQALSFVSAAHLYSIFNNAFGNALEALSQIEDPHQKVIDLTVKKETGFVVIEMSNYCVEKALPSTGELQTSKADKAHHGYGLKSIAYVAENYQGVVHTQVEKNVFTLQIKLLPPAAPAESAPAPSVSRS